MTYLLLVLVLALQGALLIWLHNLRDEITAGQNEVHAHLRHLEDTLTEGKPKRPDLIEID